MKKLIAVIVLTALIVTAFAGCIPSEYKKGLKLGRDYPDKELPIYDDAIVFSYEEDDDGEVTLEAGTEDDVDDVADFYKDLFEDEADNFIIISQKEDKDEYSANGIIIDEELQFEIEVTEAKGKYEEKLFSAEMEITIEPADEDFIDRYFAKQDSYIISIYATEEQTTFVLDHDLLDAETYEAYIDGTLVGESTYGYIDIDRTLFDSLKEVTLKALDRSNDILAEYAIYVFDGLGNDDFVSAIDNSTEATSLVILGYTFQTGDLQTLSLLSNLKKLHWIDCTFKKIDAISTMTGLEHLDLGFAGMFSNFSPIGSLVNLKTLMVSSLSGDISSLANLTKLEYLRMDFMESDDLSSIASLTNLKYLDLSWSYNLPSIKSLEDLASLTSLSLNACNISDVSFLSALTNLTDLALGYNDITDLTSLSVLSNLVNLELSSCENLSDISPLAGLKHLEYLDLFGCDNVTDLTPLDDIKDLEIFK
ncbi:MAG: hypothetical protein KAQ68_07215 [Clostridiales bacterium]|nr:hypothetical protein [Clostridiales bacterium]